MLGWRDTAGGDILRRVVTWQLAHPLGEPDHDLSADDTARASAG